MRNPIEAIARGAVILLAAGSVLSATGLASADGLDTRLICPRSVEVGAFPALDLRIENSLCTNQTVRILSTVVGNGDESTAGVAILGPSVAERSVTIPAATDELSGACINFRCEPSPFVFCSSSADCICRVVTKGIANLEVIVPTAIPAAFDETVFNQFVFTDRMDGSKTLSDTCRIHVPEPARALQLATVLVVVHSLRRRRHRFFHPQENPA